MRIPHHILTDICAAACCLLLAALVIASTVLGAESQSWSVRFPVVPSQPVSLKPSSPPPQTPAPAPQTLAAVATPVTQSQTAPVRPAAPQAQAKADPAAPASSQPQVAGTEPGQMQEPSLPNKSADPRQDYIDAINTALNSSPQFKTTRIDIEVSKLGEKDSWYRLFPKLSLNVSYSKPLNKLNTSPPPQSYLSVGFSTGTYDPIAAYIGHDASKVATSLAEAMHTLAIEDLMEKVGISFVKLDSLQDLIECRKELAKLSQKLMEYTGQRTDKGSVSQLDKRVVDLKDSMAQKELTQEINRHTQELIKLKRLLGLTAEQKVNFDIPNSLPQIVGKQSTFTMPAFSQVEQHNIRLKTLKIKEKLQTFRVRLAMAEHLPKFIIGLTTPDPTATKDTSSPYYLGLGVSIPVWSWGETMRSVEREEFTVQKLAVNNALTIAEMQAAWDSTAIDISMLKDQITIAASMRELRELEAKRKTIGQQVGNVSYEVLIDAKAAAVHARIAEIKVQEEYSVALVKIRTQSGALFNEHIRISHGHME